MAQSFQGYVTEWAKQTEARMLAVFQLAVNYLADELRNGRGHGGPVPELTGNMIRSLLAEINGPVMMKGGEFPVAGDVGAQIALSRLGDAITLGYAAVYARRVNYGFSGTDSLGRNYNQEGVHWVERAAALWPDCVARAARDIEQRANA